MSGLLQTLREKPMLLQQAGGLIIAWPLRFVDLGTIAETQRISRQRIGNSVGSQSVHADLTTQEGGQHHGA